MDLRILLVLLIWTVNTATPYSIEKHIMESATSLDMFDLFHVMPSGMMEIVQELDMLLTIEQHSALHMESSGRSKRKAYNNVFIRWPDGKIYYEITDSLSLSSDEDSINIAIAEWEKYTNLTFEKSNSATSRIQFMDGKSCLSSVGMQDKPQPLFLAPGCRNKGVIVHEIGHAIGWVHEHMRPDRDDYLNINRRLILDKDLHNYEKYNWDVIDTYGVAYDYTSIMHYGGTGDPKIMTTRDPSYQSKIGQRVGLSFKDIKLANLMYPNTCVEKDCGDGIQLPKKLEDQPPCQCWCDSGSLTDPLVRCDERDTTAPPPDVTLPPSTSGPAMECMDAKSDCEKLKTYGKCTDMSYMSQMMTYCAKTCGFCGMGEEMCVDYESGCGVMKDMCQKPGLNSTMSTNCKQTCGLCGGSPTNPCDVQRIMLGDKPKGTKGQGVSTLKRSNGAVLNVLLALIFSLSSRMITIGG